MLLSNQSWLLFGRAHCYIVAATQGVWQGRGTADHVTAVVAVYELRNSPDGALWPSLINYVAYVPPCHAVAHVYLELKYLQYKM
jgi:hypothetical protein